MNDIPLFDNKSSYRKFGVFLLVVSMFATWFWYQLLRLYDEPVFIVLLVFQNIGALGSAWMIARTFKK